MTYCAADLQHGVKEAYSQISLHALHQFGQLAGLFEPLCVVTAANELQK